MKRDGIDTSTEIPEEELQAMALHNAVQIILNHFLDNNHTEIFQSEDADKKDYAVASVEPDNLKSFLQKWAEWEQDNNKAYSPKPTLTFYRRKKEVYKLLGRNPYSAATWRYSPSLIWQL